MNHARLTRPIGMLNAIFATVVCITLLATPPVRAALETPPAVETIILIRHGEKPPQGLGLLTCQGLNRALMLPDFFAAHFPKPDYIFAPDPSVKATEVHGDGLRYDYVRPLLTIGPTAVHFGVPINTQLPFNDPGLLADVLLAPQYANATIYVAWEHINAVTFAQIVLRRFNVTATVPEWSNSDYSMVFVLTISSDEPRTVKLEISNEGLDGLSDECPIARTAH